MLSVPWLQNGFVVIGSIPTEKANSRVTRNEQRVGLKFFSKRPSESNQSPIDNYGRTIYKFG
jgi:hypothetical protein